MRAKKDPRCRKKPFAHHRTGVIVLRDTTDSVQSEIPNTVITHLFTISRTLAKMNVSSCLHVMQSRTSIVYLMNYAQSFKKNYLVSIKSTLLTSFPNSRSANMRRRLNNLFFASS